MGLFWDTHILIVLTYFHGPEAHRVKEASRRQSQIETVTDAVNKAAQHQQNR